VGWGSNGPGLVPVHLEEYLTYAIDL
jgi:hypothetical protein